MVTENPNPKTRPGRFQFGLFAIFVLTTVCAAIAGLTRAIDVPPLARYLFAGYLIALAIPLVLRMPGWVRKWTGAAAELKRIEAERQQLQAWADQRRREHREATGNEGQNGVEAQRSEPR